MIKLSTAVTIVATRRQLHLDGDLVAEHRLLERDVGHDLEILAARRACGPSTSAAAAERAATTTTAEERLEDVAEPSAEDVVGGGSTRGAADSGLAVAVVAGTLLIIGEDPIGLSDFLELFGGVGRLGTRWRQCK